MAKYIPDEGKAAYYCGTFLIGAGFVLFLLIYIAILMSINDSSNVKPNTQAEIFYSLLGAAFIIIGGILRSIGSGVILAPKQARSELEPYSQMAGGVVQDALDEANLDFGQEEPDKIMIKCRECEKLNEEDAKFCNECGKPI